MQTPPNKTKWTTSAETSPSEPSSSSGSSPLSSSCSSCCSIGLLDIVPLDKLGVVVIFKGREGLDGFVKTIVRLLGTLGGSSVGGVSITDSKLTFSIS